MKTEAEVNRLIQEIESAYKHVLTGGLATVAVNAPRALEQVAAESKLQTLHWVLDTRYKTKLEGVDR